MNGEGVGTVLKRWIPEWIQIEKRTACQCEKLREEMDNLGPDGVEEQIEKFIDHFVSQKRYLRHSLQVTPEWVMRNWCRLVIKRACNKVRRDTATKPNRRR